MKGARDAPQLRVRIPQELKDALDKISNQNDRTLTAEIIRRLRESLERDGITLEVKTL